MTQPNLPHPPMCSAILVTDEDCQGREALRTAKRTLDNRKRERIITQQGDGVGVRS